MLGVSCGAAGGGARTASIRARPASGRITAAELEELFQRQADADADLDTTLVYTVHLKL